MKKLLASLAAVTAVLATSGCGLLGGGPREITAVFPDSAGLFLGNDVGVLGVAVGKVTKIQPDGSAVKVTLEITDGDVKIPANVGAAVVARSVATDRYVELTPVYSKGPQMKDGATIPVQRTVTPVDFDKVLASLNDFSSGLTSSKATTNGLRDLVSVTAKSLDGNGKKINTTISSLSEAVNGVSGQSDNIVGTLRSLDSLSGTLADNEQVVRRFIKDVKDASDLAATERYNIGGALKTLQQAVEDIAAFARENRAQIRGNVADLTTVLKNLLESSDDINGVLDNMPLATDNLARAISKNDRARVKIDPNALNPGGALVDQLCKALNVCDDVIGIPPSLDGILNALGGLGGTK